MLVLGPSESISEAGELFQRLEGGQIFVRQRMAAAALELGRRPPAPGRGRALPTAGGRPAAHGGQLECVSNQGRTTFRFTVPARPAATIEPQPPA
jgi:hypothetical protein